MKKVSGDRYGPEAARVVPESYLPTQFNCVGHRLVKIRPIMPDDHEATVYIEFRVVYSLIRIIHDKPHICLVTPKARIDVNAHILPQIVVVTLLTHQLIYPLPFGHQRICVITRSRFNCTRRTKSFRIQACQCGICDIDIHLSKRERLARYYMEIQLRTLALTYNLLVYHRIEIALR